MNTLKLGAEGPEVETLHRLLSAKGFGPKEGATFTAETEAAVHQFQAANHLDSDGVVGEETWAALGLPTPGPAPESELTRQRAWLRAQIPWDVGSRQRAVLDAAIATFGWREQPDGSNGGPEVDRISGGYYPEGQGKPPWCALAVLFWLKEGLRATDWRETPFGARFGAVSQIVDWARSNQRLVQPANAGVIEPGTVFVMRRAGSGSDEASGAGAGHTGIVVKDEGARLITVEGNTGNRVWSHARLKAQLTGFVTWW